ncbi:hypothetical protein HWV62_331 [Athelia sp. TMB]|nr:hypothetical protein HWV62_331 [Athelia sp. TMB]
MRRKQTANKKDDISNALDALNTYGRVLSIRGSLSLTPCSNHAADIKAPRAANDITSLSPNTQASFSPGSSSQAKDTGNHLGDEINTEKGNFTLGVEKNGAQPQVCRSPAMALGANSNLKRGKCMRPLSFMHELKRLVEHVALWQTEFVLARDFAHGRHDQDDVKSFTSIRRAMIRGFQPLSPYSLTVLSTVEEDLREESKVRREAVVTLRASAKCIREAEWVYTEFLNNIDRGVY